jgi:WD40 repeat protein
VGNNCPSSGELLAFHVGSLADDRIDAVADHLEKCPRCEKALRQLDGSGDKALAAVRLAGTIVPVEADAGNLARYTAAGMRREPDLTAPENWPQLPGYEVVAAIGSGITGTVYRARQIRSGEAVALKRIRRRPARDLTRWRTEAETLARLKHPNIVRINELVEHSGEVFLVQELVEGGPLTAYLRGKPLNQSDVAVVLETISHAVEHAHRLGIFHGDLKPANILLQRQEGSEAILSGARGGITSSLLSPAPLVPKVADFGIARVLAPTEGESAEGDVFGTPGYMAPEQCAGRLDPVGPATDVYSLGVILYEMLTGRVPILGTTRRDTLALVRTEDPVSPRRLQPRLARDLETICLRCLEKQPSQRYASAEALADDLRRFRYHKPIHARPASVVDRFGKFAGRHTAALVAGVGVGMAAIVGLAFALIFAITEGRQRRMAEDYAVLVDQERQVALHEAYRGQLAAASAALLAHDVPETVFHLDSAPESLREWEWHYLRSRLDESSIVYRPAEGESLQLLPNMPGIGIARTAASGVRLSDAEDQPTLVFPFKFNGVLRLGSTPGETRVISLEADGTEVLDGEGKHLLRLPHADRAIASPDGTKVALDHLPADRMTIYQVRDGQALFSLVGHAKHICAAAFSPDGKQIATASEDGTARVWNAADGKEKWVLRGHTAKVIRVAYRPDGKRLLSASADGTVRQWDAETGAESEPPYDRHAGAVTAAVYSPDGSQIASGGPDRTVRVWRAAGRRDVVVRHGHTGAIGELAFAPDGRRLASFGPDGTVRIWDLSEQTIFPGLRGHTSDVSRVAYSPNGRWIASASWDGTVRIWDASTREVHRVLRHASQVVDLAFTPDGLRLVSVCGADDVLRLWDIARGAISKEIKLSENLGWTLTINPDGSRIAATDASGVTTVVDSASGTRTASFQADGRCRLACSPDGRLLAGGSPGGKVFLWNLPESRPEGDLPGHSATVTDVSFSADGRRLVSASLDRTLRVWDVNSRRCLVVLNGQSDEILAAVFHPEGRRIASAGRDGVIRLWNVVTGSEVARLRGHTNCVRSLAFSPDGTTLVSGSGDGTVRLWDKETAAIRYRALRHQVPGL